MIGHLSLDEQKAARSEADVLHQMIRKGTCEEFIWETCHAWIEADPFNKAHYLKVTNDAIENWGYIARGYKDEIKSTE